MDTSIDTHLNNIEACITAIVQQNEAATAAVAKNQSFLNALQAALQAVKG
jgi:hypothetical protein